MTPQELAADLRTRINPLYASQLGTESYERRLCAEAIEGLIAELAALKQQHKQDGLDAATMAQDYCRKLWGAARGRPEWREAHNGFVAGYLAAGATCKGALQVPAEDIEGKAEALAIAIYEAVNNDAATRTPWTYLDPGEWDKWRRVANLAAGAQPKLFKCNGCGRQGTQAELEATDDGECDCWKYLERVLPSAAAPMQAGAQEPRTKSFAETHPANSDAKCKCEHWQHCAECHPTAHT